MWTTNELKSSARTIEGELQALGDTIDVVEKNRAKFRIDDSELMERKKFVSDTWAVINEIKQALNSNEFKAKQEHENRRVS